MLGAQAQPPAGEMVAQQSIPDAPRPKGPLSLEGVTPGKGSTSSSESDNQNGAAAAPAASQPAPASAPAAGTPPADQTPTYVPPAGEGAEAIKSLIVRVNAVDVPFTVKDKKGNLVAGLTPRDVRIFENGSLQHISAFTADALPLSVALVIDQSMTQDQMTRVNDSLGALQDAFTNYDEIAVFTYNKSAKNITDFTGAQSPRLTQAIERSKGGGRDTMMAGSLSGPLSQTTVINDYNVDPNTAAVRGHTGMQLTPPKEVHPLNDAILAAATALSRRPVERRRVIYVISNGNEYGSQAKTSEVIKYLLANRIEVDGTLVGDTALPFIGKLDHFHLPLMMRENVLIAYKNATGGNFDAEFRTASIEKSFARIAEEVRTRYTAVYYTHEPLIDGKYRKLEVLVVGHGNDLTVLAKPGYWPSAVEQVPRPAAARQ